MVSNRLRRRLVQGGSFALAGVLLWLALRGVDTGAVAEAFRNADYRWLIPLVAIALGSHALRAWRWQLLLEALPPEKDAPGTPGPARAAPRRVSLRASFYSVMIGYMVNYAAPRLGDVARTANLSAREKLRFSSVFGTVVVEHLLDVGVLALALAAAALLLLDQMALLDERFLSPLRAQFESIPAGGWAALALGLIVAVAVLAFWVYYQSFREAPSQETSSTPGSFWQTRVRPALTSFKNGMLTLLRSPRRGALALSTLAMWGCYLLMAYLPLLMFGMTAPYGLGLADAWVLMTLGAVGATIPAPGGIGSYHYIMIQALVFLFGVPRAPAATYAVLTHAFQLILYTLTGGLCLVLQGSSFRSLHRITRTAARETER